MMRCYLMLAHYVNVTIETDKDLETNNQWYYFIFRECRVNLYLLHYEGDATPQLQEHKMYYDIIGCFG